LSYSPPRSSIIADQPNSLAN